MSHQRQMSLTYSQSNMASYFAPLNSQVKEADLHSKIHVQEGEKMTSLHSKLHLEADKIRRWKVQTEIELKQKDKKIHDANQTVDSLRKSILELQLQHENLSGRLHEEMDNREEIIQRINSTRNMCSVLKDYTVRIEDRLQKCETERTELKYIEKEHIKHFEDLTTQFNTLQISATENKHNLMNELEVEKDEKSKLKEDYHMNLSHLEGKLDDLSEQCVGKEEEIAALQEKLTNNFTKLTELKEKHDNLNVKFVNIEEVAEDEKKQLATMQMELQQTHVDKSNLKCSLNEEKTKLEHTLLNKDKLAKNFDETEKLYVNKIETLSEEISQVQEDLLVQEKRVSELETSCSSYQASIENLKSSKDMLTLEKNDIHANLKKMENSHEKLFMKYENLEEFNRITINDRNALHDAVDSLKEQTSKLEESEGLLKTELEKASEQQQELLKKLNSAQNQLEHESTAHHTGLEKIQVLKEEKMCLQKEFNSSKKDINKLTKDLEKSYSKATQQDTKMEVLLEEKENLLKEIFELKNIVQEESNKSEHLIQNEQSNVQSIQLELQKKSKALSDLEAKMKTYKEDISCKNKQIKDVEKEVKTLKGKLTTQTKLAAALEDHDKELDVKIIEKNGIVATLQGEIGKLKKEFEQERMKSEKKLKEVDKAVKKTDKEKEITQQKFEMEMKEMVVTLEKYKQENEKIVDLKEKELEQMKQRMEENGIKAKQLQENVIDEMKKKLDDAEKQLHSVTKEKENIVDEMKKKLDGAEKQLHSVTKEKEKILDEMKKKLEGAEKQLCSVTKKKEKTIDEMKKKFDDAEKKFYKLTQEKKNELKDLTVTINKLKEKPQIVPSTPKMPLRERQVYASAPNMPNGQQAGFTEVTPQCQRIGKLSKDRNLKLTSSTPTKRRVAFAEKDEDINSDLSDAESSSSDLMEIELDEVENRLKKPKNSTPLFVKPSPALRVAQSPMTPTYGRKSGMNKSLKPVPRGLAFPKQQPKKHKNISKGTANFKNTPSKNMPKFFKTSPMDRKRTVRQLPEDLAWFDSDSVFAFDE